VVTVVVQHCVGSITGKLDCWHCLDCGNGSVGICYVYAGVFCAKGRNSYVKVSKQIFG